MTLEVCIGQVAPYYNLALVIIVVALFIKLFSLKTKIFLLPWKLLFVAVLIYILEEILTVVAISGLAPIPRILNAFFEFFMITIFIYLLLVQKEYVQKKTK